MKLGTLKSKSSRDGELCVVGRDLKRAVRVTSIAPSLREAMENWTTVAPRLKKVSDELNSGKADGAFAVKLEDFHSALPRTWLFADGSAFIHHIKLVRMARKAALPETLQTVPLMYQAECGQFLAPDQDIPQRDFAHGTDFEAEVGVIVDDVPMGVSPEKALEHIQLVVLINDVSLRGLIPGELGQGFGFFQSKPASALSPFAVTVDELSDSWKEGRLHLPLNVQYNEQFFGKANAGQMHFHFGQLIAHAAKTRNLVAGTLIGSGTVSNEDPAMGSSCLAEKRMIEQIAKGQPETSFMKVGDTVEIWMQDAAGQDIFGHIRQAVKKAL
ncbi:MAG: 2-keto-4-pentenoate hydratase [Bdellovibrio sp. CG10_big_fil_rev_8_21_14_0_10_47_8]|nr:MAG: 2-keto-4-pentenoate hydratase [Bdellovibrio sp. CG10_big_fil_rev_8_21_14_0_10_47_8]